MPHPRSSCVLALALAWLLPCLPLHAAAKIVPIGEVQGRAHGSPLLGREVVVEGVVVADLREGLGGVFVQDAGDGDPATSDALFVQGRIATIGAAGDRVRVRGPVRELPAGDGATLTAIEAADVQVLARGQPVPVTTLQAPPADWEALEGRRVRIGVPLTLAGSDRLQRYGELSAAFGGRLWQASEVAAPGTPAFAAAETDTARRRVLLDDGSGRRDPERVAYLDDAGALRSGMLLHEVEGVVDQRYDGGYRLQLLRPLRLSAPERPAAPTVAGRLRIAAFNLENFFNGNGRGGGFPTKRGARTPAQMQAQLDKLVATIQPLQADIAALMELENDGYDADASIATLVAALNAAGDGDWRFVDAGTGPGSNPIRVGLIYRSSRVTPVGRPARLEGGPFAEHSRVPLAQAFRTGAGPAFVVVANHFKSKGCGQAEGADADRHDGQACWNATRTESARQLDRWLRTDPTGAGTGHAVLLGDFNAYAMEDPLRTLRAQGWRDAFAAAGIERPYSFVYGGLSGRLDHALLSPAMAAGLRGAAEWHINADEQEEQGYQARNLEGPWRSSDHDPLLLGFDL